MNVDPAVRELREQITENDRRLVDTINTRLQLVAQLRRVKEERGMDFLDPDREAWMLQHLQEANTGPLSAEGLRELYDRILDLTKREVARD